MNVRPHSTRLLVGAYRIRPNAPAYPRGCFRAYAIRPYIGSLRTFIIKKDGIQKIRSGSIGC